jgi:cysteine desulfurase
METEHKAVLDTCAHLRNAEVIYLKPEPTGQLNLDSLAEVLDDKVLLVSVMLVNNETGVVQPVSDIAAMAHAAGALMHSDLAQSVGKLPWTVESLGIDLGSLSAHKIHGPKGIGGLYVRRGSCRVAEQQHGGQHERGMRSGTLPTHQIVGMGEAYRIAKAESETEIERLNQFRDRIESAISELGGIRCNGARGVPHILNITVDQVDAERLMAAMPQIAVSTGSACNSATIEPSHVLQSMGLNRHLGLSSLRISLGRMTTSDELSILIDTLTNAVSQLRSTA